MADMIGIFNFGFSESGAARDAPVDWLFAAINKALIDDVREEPEFIGFVFLVESQVGIIPIAKDAEAFELGALQVDVFSGVGIAGRSNRGRIAVRLPSGAVALAAAASSIATWLVRPSLSES